MGQTTLKLFESNFMPTVVFVEYISLIVSTLKMNCQQNSSFSAGLSSSRAEVT